MAIWLKYTTVLGLHGMHKQEVSMLLQVQSKQSDMKLMWQKHSCDIAASFVLSNCLVRGCTSLNIEKQNKLNLLESIVGTYKQK